MRICFMRANKQKKNFFFKRKKKVVIWGLCNLTSNKTIYLYINKMGYI